MENAILIGLSRQMALQRRMDVIANNLANVGTSGYKADSMRFEHHMVPHVNTGEGRRALSYVHDAGLVRDFTPGDLHKTDNKFDVAISGDGWLVVQTPEGNRYTRNGELHLNAEGQLVTKDGHPVMGEAGVINFELEETSVMIAKDGTISTNTGPKDRLLVVSFADNNGLAKLGHNMFQTDQEPQASEGEVLQGMIERSNVQAVSELTRMIETTRAYTTMSQLLSRHDDLQRDAISQLGRDV